MGLADVFVLSWLRWFLVGIALLKGLDAYQFDRSLALGYLVVAVSAAVSERHGCLTLAIFMMTGAALDRGRMTNHTVFFGWVALILAFWGDYRIRHRLLQIQVCVVYFFAGLAKLNPRFLSGEVIAERLDGFAHPQYFAYAAILAELSLCLAVGLRWRWTLAAAIVFHFCLSIGWTTDLFGDGPGIILFNIMLVAVVAVVVEGHPDNLVEPPPAMAQPIETGRASG